MKRKICVIGAGVIGISSAVCIQEINPATEVTVIADSFTPNTTSDGSAGFWEPFYPSPIQTELYRKWGIQTFHHLRKLTQSPEGGIIGAQFVSGYLFSRNKDSPKDPQWKKDLVIGYRNLTKQDMEIYPQYKEGTFYTTVIVDQVPYITWLMGRFKTNGGIVLCKKVKSFFEISEHYDIIVNCTGLGSRDLIGDTDLHPIKGQVIRVQAPWVKHFYMDKDPSDDHKEIYILPGANSIALGGSGHVNNWSLDVVKEDRERIWRECCKLVPSLRHAKILYDWVGLRPARSAVRLELEEKTHRGKQSVIVHNYGHGGSGVTIHWGCALDTADLVQKTLRKISLSSKL